MNNTKIVTGYWMGINEAPYYGVTPHREDRYIGSLISHCRGFNVPVVCYTHSRDFELLEKIKKEYDLNNLELKILELDQTKCHEKVEKLRQKYDVITKFPDLHGRTPEVLWTKFEVLQKEITEGIEYVYWVDVGLQHPGIFPWRLHPEISDPSLNKVPYKQWNFNTLFNQKMLDRCNQITKDRIIILSTREKDYGIPELPLSSIEHLQSLCTEAIYPIAGFFGGDVKAVNKFCNLFWEFADIYIANEILSTEQTLMKYCCDYSSPSELLNFRFGRHHVPYINDREDTLWDLTQSMNIKPLYTVFYDILNYEIS